MKINFDVIFKRLDEELSKIGQSLELVCAGGYVLQRHGYRATLDVDAFYESNVQIDNIIKKVGDEFGINKEDELWLNNSISNLNPEPPTEYCEIVHKFDNLTVKEVKIIYLVGMKLYSQREQDLRDVANILRQDNDEQPFELLLKLKDMKFDIDISLLLEAFEIAHGMDWLDNFYTDNAEELRKYF
jgi:hypothetical protein